MAGRLEGVVDEFARIVENNRTGEVKPVRPQADRKTVRRSLSAYNRYVVINLSRENGLIALVFYVGKYRGGYRKVYRRIVVPKARLGRPNKRYVEVIDVIEMRRKTFRRDRIANAKLTGVKFEANQSAIGFASRRG